MSSKQGLLVDGSITAYDVGAIGTDDEFIKPLLASELKELFTRVDTQYTENLESGDMDMVVQEINLESREIMMYNMKEDWIFDKQRSTMDIRIIGIAPMKEKRGEDGEIRGIYTDLFWLYYPELPLRIRELGCVQPGERCRTSFLRGHLLEAPVQQLHHQVEQRVRPGYQSSTRPVSMPCWKAKRSSSNSSSSNTTSGTSDRAPIMHGSPSRSRGFFVRAEDDFRTLDVLDP
jgi:hypothetical protein